MWAMPGFNMAKVCVFVNESVEVWMDSLTFISQAVHPLFLLLSKPEFKTNKCWHFMSNISKVISPHIVSTKYPIKLKATVMEDETKLQSSYKVALLSVSSLRSPAASLCSWF